MDSHTATAVAEAHTSEAPAPEAAPDPISNIPEAPAEESLSFTDALDAALSNLESNTEPEPEPQTPEPEPQPEASETQTEEQVTETTDQESSTEESAPESTEPIDELTDSVGDDWTPKAASRFKQLKAELKTNQSEVDKLRQTVSEQEAKLKEMSGLVENRDIDQLQERVADYEFDRVINDLESTDAYRQAVTEPLGELMEQAHQIADKYEVDTDKLIDALAMEDTEAQDESLSAMLSDASDRDKARIYNIIDSIDPILERRQHLMSNAEGALQEAQAMEEQRYNQELAEQAQIRSNVTRSVADRVSEKLPFLSGVEGVDMDGIRDSVSELNPSTLHPVDFAYNAVAARLLPVIVREYLGARKEAESLTDQLSGYEEAEPTMSGTPASDGSSRRASSDLSFTDAITAALGG